jgi:Dolichyl-phosphate-mannose-protein mannosyltransferase
VQLTAAAPARRLNAERAWPTVRALALPAITALAALIRFRGLWEPSPSASEIQAMRLAITPMGRLVAAGLPPGYSLLLGQWMGHFGTALPVLRLPGALASTLCVVAVYMVVSPQSSREVGLMAALIAAVLPTWALDGQQIGPLSFTVLLALLSTWALGRAMRSTSPWAWAIYLILLTACLYTAQVAAVVLVAHLVWISIRWPDLRTWQRLAAVIALVDAVLACTPWLRGLPGDLAGSAPALVTGFAVIFPAALLPPMTVFPRWRAPRRAALAGLVVVAVLAGALVPASALLDQQRQDLATAVTYLEQHAAPRDAVVVASAADTDAFLYLAHDNLPLYDLAATGDPGFTALLQNIAVGRQHLWLVSAGGAEPALLAAIQDSLSTFGARPRTGFSGRLVAIDLTAPSAAPEQPRPATVQERRALGRQPLTLRRPLDLSRAPAGATWRLGGDPVGGPRPRTIWYFAAAPQFIDDARLDLLNPSLAPITARVQVRTITVADERDVQVPALGDLEMALAPMSHDSVSEVIVTAAEPLVATRSQLDAGSLLITAGLTSVPPPFPAAQKLTP